MEPQAYIIWGETFKGKNNKVSHLRTFLQNDLKNHNKLQILKN